MDRDAILVVTGASGFIGSCLVGYLNQLGYEKIILVDEFDDEEKKLNLLDKKYLVRVEREGFFEWYRKEEPKIDYIFHLGARTDTTEFDYSIHQHLNVEYSQKIWDLCTANEISMLYASSAATYGDGAFGYNDYHDLSEKLVPLNPYGVSKNEFDKWVLKQQSHPPSWAGLKFFNVYGPNEYHKARMASVVFHSFNQIKKYGKVKLFKSHKVGFRDGEQLRDFIYVKDIIKVCVWFFENKPESAIYNLGTGKAETFNNLVNSIFIAMNLQPLIDYIDIPEDIRDKYQYFTEAKMEKLRNAGYDDKFYSTEEGVKDYVKEYLMKQLYF
jgi:ADP-L-glycero-D-manno-heptose 6-epimerase